MSWKPWVVIATLGLAGCVSDNGPQIVLTAPTQVTRQKLKDIVPKAILTCKSEPGAADVKTVRQAAAFIVGLRAAGADCRQKLGTVRDLIQNER